MANFMNSIKMLLEGKTEQTSVDKAHYCATHVEHATYGKGVCISEQHAEPDNNGNIEWYTVQFEGKQPMKIMTAEMKVLQAEGHMHSKKKMKEETEQIDEKLVGNQHKIDANKNQEIDAEDFKILRGKKKTNEESEQVAEAELKPGESAPGIKGKFPSKDDKKQEPSKFEKTKTEKGTKYSRTLANEEISVEGGDSLTRGMKLISRHGHASGAYHAKVYKDPEYNEYQVHFYKDGIHLGERPVSYHGNDKEDAQNTADSALERMNHALKRRTNFEEVEQEDSNLIETVIKHNDFIVELPEELTYADFLHAVRTIVDTEDPQYQSQIISVAAEAYDCQEYELIIEARTKEFAQKTVSDLRKSGKKVTDPEMVTHQGKPGYQYTVTDGDKQTVTIHTAQGVVRKVK